MQISMEDIELARSLLEEEKWNLVIAKEGQIPFRSREHGIAPFSQAVQSMGKSLHNAAVADHIVGSAIAMLYLHARIISVYAGIATKGAIDMLKRQEVTVSSKRIVAYISNYDGTDMCPFEKLARNSENPAQLFSNLKSMFGGHSDDGDELQ
jgi:hypothetical protein